MDTSTYKSFKYLGEDFLASYRKRLESLLTQEEFFCFYEVINVMREHGRTLEQEAVPIKNS
jgi:hypothetical protein